MKLKNLLVLLLLNTVNCFAQYDIQITVTDALTHEPLPFATLYLKESGKGTRTDFEGKGKLFLKYRRDTLIVSYIGYKDYKELIYTDKEKIALNIALETSNQLLNIVEISSLKNYPPEEIIKKAIKNQKHNYVNVYSLSNGFYRESIKENDNWIMMNEAVIQLKYSPYPQKYFLHKAFRSYRKLDGLPWNLSAASEFKHMLRFASFVPVKKDQVKVISSRVSQDQSRFGIQTAPVGGPADLIALDKLKYTYDFFDPKMIKEYNYKMVGEKNYKGEKCYVIDFYPKKTYTERIHQSLSEKMKYPIYLGRIYVSGETFSVLNFEFELTNNVDFSTYSSRIGIVDYIKVKVDYIKHDTKWLLNSVQTGTKKK